MTLYRAELFFDGNAYLPNGDDDPSGLHDTIERLYPGLRDWLDTNCPDHEFRFKGMTFEDGNPPGMHDIVIAEVVFNSAKSAALARLFLPDHAVIRQASCGPA